MAVVQESLYNLIENIAKDLKYKNYQIKLTPFSSDGANYATTLFVSTISAKGRENVELFAKVAIVDKEMRSKMEINQAYITEHKFYTDLLKIYEKLQEENDLPVEQRLVTAKYYASTDKINEETLILENVKAKGFTLYDRMKSVDWKYASKSIEELAKFHALSFAHGKRDPEGFKKLIKEKKSVFSDNSVIKEMFETMSITAVKVCKMEYRDRFEKYITEQILPNTDKYFEPLRRPIVIHGDYRPSNLMHKEDDDGNLKVIILDYQTLCAGCCVSDLMYFIFNGCDEEFRSKYFDKLVEHYYTQLCLALRRLHVDLEEVYPREDFDYEYRKKLPFGLLVAIFTLQIVTVEAADAPDVNSGDLNVKTSDLYSERLNGIVNDYVKWGII